MLYTPLSDFYSLLQIPRDASLNDIKVAYHHTLLRLHPDKQARSRAHPGVGVTLDAVTPTQSRRSPPREETGDMALLKEAYRTLSNMDSRAAYDVLLRREERAQLNGPRPAQIISLEEFTTIEADMGKGIGTVTVTETGAAQEWQYRCRCGGTYRITEDDLENGTHLVGCENCSEVIWVGYMEAVITDEEE